MVSFVKGIGLKVRARELKQACFPPGLELTSWLTEGDEMSSILWSCAALKHLDIPPQVVFHCDGYKEESDWIIKQLENGVYNGLPLLVWMGLYEEGEFPKMKKWLRS